MPLMNERIADAPQAVRTRPTRFLEMREDEGRQQKLAMNTQSSED